MTMTAMKGLPRAVPLFVCLLALPMMAQAHGYHRLRHHYAATPTSTDDEVASDDLTGASWEQSGTASWYGPGFVGRMTTMGTVFDPREMTAAHTTLPMGTRLMVTERYSGRSIVVTVTDRLPPHRYRILDLSRGAASALGIMHRGLAQVTLRRLDPGAEPLEVAEAPDDAAPLDDPSLIARPVSHARHGLRHRRHGRP